MRTRIPLTTLTALGLMSLSTPALAVAAPAKVGARPTAGGVAIKIANPNRYAVKGSVALVSGKKTVASKRTSIAGRKAKTITLSGHGLRSATLVTKLGKPGSTPTVKRRSVSLGSVQSGGKGLGPSAVGGGNAGGGQPGSGKAPAGSGGSSGGSQGGGNPDPTPPPGNHWIATASGGGSFGFTVVNGAVALDQQITMSVLCQEAGGNYTSAWSWEVFDPTTGWALGNQSATQTEQHARANQYAGSSPHSVKYRLSTTQDGADHITGDLYQSYANSSYDPFNNTIRFWNCSGDVDFTASRG